MENTYRIILDMKGLTMQNKGGLFEMTKHEYYTYTKEELLNKGAKLPRSIMATDSPWVMAASAMMLADPVPMRMTSYFFMSKTPLLFSFILNTTFFV